MATAKLVLLLSASCLMVECQHHQQQCLTVSPCSTAPYNPSNVQDTYQGAPGKRGPAGERGLIGLVGPPGQKGEAGEGVDEDFLNELAAIKKKNAEMDQFKTRVRDWLIQPDVGPIDLCGMGMQDGAIADDQITASSFWRNHDGDHMRHGRLFAQTGSGGWAADERTGNEHWIQADLGSDRKVTGVVTQGCYMHNQWVTSFYVSYRTDGSDELAEVTNESGDRELFQGNYDRRTPVTRRFPQPVVARFVRINIISWSSHPTMRFEVINC